MRVGVGWRWGVMHDKKCCLQCHVCDLFICPQLKKGGVEMGLGMSYEIINTVYAGKHVM